MTILLIIEYCETRLKQDRPLNGPAWIAGYDYALNRILGIAKTGEMYHKLSVEELKKAEIRHLKSRLNDKVARISDYEKTIEKLKKEIVEISLRLSKEDNG